MNRYAYEIQLDITIEAPYLVHGNDPGRYGLDATLLTDHRGRPVLPGTLVAGRIVEVWHNLGSMLGGANPTNWFGSKGSVLGSRARLKVDDLVLQSINDQPLQVNKSGFDTTRIRQNGDTGAVDHGALFVAEQIAAPGAQLSFSGTWRTWATDDEIASLVPQLKAALLLQTQLGAYRSVGFGRVKAVQIGAASAVSAFLKLASTDDRHRFALRTDGALCVGSRSRRGNVFESTDVISGGTILGAIATMLGAKYGQPNLSNINSALAKNFSLLRCTHAIPAQAGCGRPVPLPQSLVSHNGQILDAWQHAVPPVELASVPAFQTDWKQNDYQLVQNSQRWGVTQRYLRIRTDIDSSGAAKESSLFGYECVVSPRDDNDEVSTQWLFDLDLQSIPVADRELARQELAQLLSLGLFPIGKTDALLKVENVSGSGEVWQAKDQTNMQVGELVPMLLVSDALLFPTSRVAELSEPDLLTIYKAAFHDLMQQAGCDGALELSHFFATQRLTGGDYLRSRFHRSTTYQPWVLTEAGSVFVFKVKDAASARLMFNQWSAAGLALPADVKAACGDTWDKNPYLQNNGFGEVLVAPSHDFAPLQPANHLGE